jgi:uncharacterized protein (DUF2236 family)
MSTDVSSPTAHAPRPRGIDAGPHTSDDGLFGPDSVTWKAMAHPSTGAGAATAAMIQMLYPPVMYVVDQASSFREKPELRAQRTGDYATTITYGDTDAAEKAGATLRRIHARCHAVHPDTGETLDADDPHLLVWVNNSLTWALLRAWDSYGPDLSAAERDQFVVEQKVSARLVGLDPDAVSSTVAELDAYMSAMEPKLALSAPCLWFKDLMAAAPDTGGLTAKAAKGLMVQASVALMSDHHRQLYGFAWGPVRSRLVRSTTRGLLGSAADKLPFDATIQQLRSHVDTHAFGSRRQRAVVVPEVG